MLLEAERKQREIEQKKQEAIREKERKQREEEQKKQENTTNDNIIRQRRAYKEYTHVWVF